MKVVKIESIVKKIDPHAFLNDSHKHHYDGGNYPDGIYSRFQEGVGKCSQCLLNSTGPHCKICIQEGHNFIKTM